MLPQNDHETAIAKAVDTKILNDPDFPDESIITSVVASIGFVLSISDTQFLIDYTKRCRTA